MIKDLLKMTTPLLGVLFGAAAGYIKQFWGFILGLIYGILVMLPFIMK